MVSMPADYHRLLRDNEFAMVNLHFVPFAVSQSFQCCLQVFVFVVGA